LRLIETDDCTGFVGLLERNMWLSKGSTGLDEFVLLMRIVRLERVHFLREIQYKQLFSIVQKDMKTGDSILHLAVFEGKNVFVRALLEALFEVDEINLRNEDGNTPLSYACITGNLEIVKLLHAKGANMAHKNNAGLTPLLLAIYHSHYFVVHYLMSVEQVFDSVTSALDIFKSLQFSISGTCQTSSSQIFFLLYEVLETRIEYVFGHF